MFNATEYLRYQETCCLLHKHGRVTATFQQDRTGECVCVCVCVCVLCMCVNHQLIKVHNYVSYVQYIRTPFSLVCILCLFGNFLIADGAEVVIVAVVNEHL